tara:strand:- start:291 stop:512 length:222 start_codon:yes stop_codon:yes gene_type:complete
MNNRITIKKRTYLNRKYPNGNYANFEFSDTNGKGFIISVMESDTLGKGKGKTIVDIFNISKGIVIKTDKKRGI